MAGALLRARLLQESVDRPRVELRGLATVRHREVHDGVVRADLRAPRRGICEVSGHRPSAERLDRGLRMARAGEAAHLVPEPHQRANERTPDVATGPGYQDAHSSSSPCSGLRPAAIGPAGGEAAYRSRHATDTSDSLRP